MLSTWSELWDLKQQISVAQLQQEHRKVEKKHKQLLKSKTLLNKLMQTQIINDRPEILATIKKALGKSCLGAFLSYKRMNVSLIKTVMYLSLNVLQGTLYKVTVV